MIPALFSPGWEYQEYSLVNTWLQQPAIVISRFKDIDDGVWGDIWNFTLRSLNEYEIANYIKWKVSHVNENWFLFPWCISPFMTITMSTYNKLIVWRKLQHRVVYPLHLWKTKCCNAWEAQCGKPFWAYENGCNWVSYDIILRENWVAPHFLFNSQRVKTWCRL